MMMMIIIICNDDNNKCDKKCLFFFALEIFFCVFGNSSVKSRLIAASTDRVSFSNQRSLLIVGMTSNEARLSEKIKNRKQYFVIYMMATGRN